MKKSLISLGIVGVLLAVLAVALLFIVPQMKMEAPMMRLPSRQKAIPPMVPAPQDLSQIVEDEIRNLTPGRILFNPPEEMKVGVKERVEVRIVKNFTENLSIGLRGRGVPQIEEIKVNTLMGVRLNGDNFDINKTLSHEEQIVAGDGFTQWNWDVTPLKSGIQLLLLTVTVRIKILNYGEERKDYPVFERKIKVNVNPIYTTKKFIESYWQWIITAILIPIIGWFVNNWRKSRKKK